MALSSQVRNNWARNKWARYGPGRKNVAARSMCARRARTCGARSDFSGRGLVWIHCVSTDLVSYIRRLLRTVPVVLLGVLLLAPLALGEQPSEPAAADGSEQPTGYTIDSALLAMDPPSPDVALRALDSDCADCPATTGPVPMDLTPLTGNGMGCPTCSGICIPGQPACSACTGETRIGRFACEIYKALTRPDPCYEPKWTPITDASFFVEAARPVSQQRLRWEAGLGMVLPDRAEYFWARADGTSKGPSPTGPRLGVERLTYHDLSMYTETSSGKFSFFFNQPYRSVYPSDSWHGAGFAPLDLGTKTLVFDCELLQIAFQFRTFIPVGNTKKGISNGHTSLEPSLIFGLRISPSTYMQGQLAEWIPLGGDSDYSGAILHYHFGLNHVVYRFLPDVPVIGTFDFNGWSFQDGAYTDPEAGPRSASGASYISLGPGLRMAVSDKIDFGVGTAFAVTSDHFANQAFRTEFRWRY